MSDAKLREVLEWDGPCEDCSGTEEDVLAHRIAVCRECGPPPGYTPPGPTREEELQEALERTLRALCLTRDYVGAEKLPAQEGWEWYDAGKVAAAAIPDSEWAGQFKLREGE
jgi:hypothetical protein